MRIFIIQIFFRHYIFYFPSSNDIQRSGKRDGGFDRLMGALLQAVQVLLAEFMVWLRHYLNWKVKNIYIYHGIKKQNKNLEGLSGNITAISP